MSNEDLDRRIRGDWYEIGEHFDKLYEIEDVFSFTVDELQSIVSDLRVSVEQGVTEYKQRKFQELFAYLDSLRFEAKKLDELSENARQFSHVLYVALIQRLIALGTVPIRSTGVHGTGDNTRISNPGVGIKEVVLEVQDRIKHDPELKNHPAVKNIFMQVNIYKRELAKMKKLVPNIPREKQKSFLSNFKQTFDDITGRVREQYRQILNEEEQAAKREIVPTNPLKRHDLLPIAPLYEAQAKDFSLVRSTLSYAAAERYKTRNILAGVVNKQNRLELLVTTEQGKYRELEPGPGGARVMSRAFGAELITVLNRQIARMR